MNIYFLENLKKIVTSLQNLRRLYWFLDGLVQYSQIFLFFFVLWKLLFDVGYIYTHTHTHTHYSRLGTLYINKHILWWHISQYNLPKCFPLAFSSTVLPSFFHFSQENMNMKCGLSQRPGQLDCASNPLGDHHKISLPLRPKSHYLHNEVFGTDAL